MAISLIGGGNRTTSINSPTCHGLLRKCIRNINVDPVILNNRKLRNRRKENKEKKTKKERKKNIHKMKIIQIRQNKENLCQRELPQMTENMSMCFG